MSPIPPKSILETAIYADDLDAAKAFYGGMLGLEPVLEEPGRHVFYRCGQQMLLIFNPAETKTVSDGPFPVPPHGVMGPGHLCFKMDGAMLDQWKSHFASKEVEIEADFNWPNGARSIYVRDPAGNSIEFAEGRLWGFE
jgi:catechol 2,3-dioxygenase-like lactoylglutathione lyase family enzyme